MKQGEWRPVRGFLWTLKEADVFCRELGCGSSVSLKSKREYRHVYGITSECVQSGSDLRVCLYPSSYRDSSVLTCLGESINDIIFDSNVSGVSL